MLPQEYWLAGSTLARREEVTPPKAEHKQIILVKTPDMWQIDTGAKTGVELIGTKKETHFSIFGKGPRIPDDAKYAENTELLKSLSFGHELEFFKAHAATKTEKKDAKGAKVEEYTLPIGTKVSLLLETDAQTNTPKTVSLKCSGQAMSLKYEKYETTPLKESVFAVPAGIKITKMTAEEFKQKRDLMKKQIMAQLQKMRQKQMDKPAGDPAQQFLKPSAPVVKISP
jgi:hypothetical protein